jgi:DNA-binding NtrC family response regulator
MNQTHNSLNMPGDNLGSACLWAVCDLHNPGAAHFPAPEYGGRVHGDKPLREDTSERHRELKTSEDQRRINAATVGTILIVDDDPAIVETHQSLVSELGYQAIGVTCPDQAEQILRSKADVVLVLLDIRMPGVNGLELLRRIKLLRPEVGVVMATVINDIEEAVRATKSGAYNYLLKPLGVQRLDDVLSSYFRNLPENISGDQRFRAFITQCPSFREIFRRIKIFAETDVPVLIEGETGTGKELIARLIHAISPRNGNNFCAVNVAALSPQLFESELFGHRRGSFTGALRDREGYFGEANGGTLFLDEIGELDPEQQKKLLRVLQTRAYCRVGETHERPLGCRLVLATNRNLSKALQTETFRPDLYYRFAGHAITLPPLCERTGDIPVLAEYFLRKYNSQYGRELLGFSAAAMEALCNYTFPGNVRELEGYISACVLLEQSTFIQPSTLPHHLVVDQNLEEDGEDLASVRFHTIMKVLAECDGNQTRAAEKLGIARGTLNRLLKKFRERPTDPTID